MRSPIAIAAFSGALLVGAPFAAFAADHGAGVPLAPSEAAGAWTVESGGRSICRVDLSAEKTAQGFGLKVSPACGQAIPGSPTAWAPTRDGMSLVGANGQSTIRFSRWSSSLFVSHTSSGVDIQLRRGGKPS
jgi:hypothetical protein